MSRLSKHHFWKWFSRHQQEYVDLPKKSKKEAAYWMDEMNAHLRAYFKFLGFTIALPHKGKATPRLTITVHGKSQHFKKVDDLVKNAPAIPGWTITALEEPKPVDFMLEELIEESGVDPREFYFSLDREEQPPVLLTVYHPLCTPENEMSLYRLANAAIYNLLGERSFGNDINDVQVLNLSTAVAKNLKELEELPDCIFSSTLVIDGNGNLVSN